MLFAGGRLLLTVGASQVSAQSRVTLVKAQEPATACQLKRVPVFLVAQVWRSALNQRGAVVPGECRCETSGFRRVYQAT